MSAAGRRAAATVRTGIAPQPSTGPLLVATVVRADSGGVWVRVTGETHDRGPLRGSTSGVAAGQDVLIAIPVNAADAWLIASP